MSEQVVTEFTIDRKTWWRGRGARDSKLLRPDDGMMCCLGHYGLACGVSPQEMLNKAEPYNLVEEESTFPPDMRWLVTEGQSIDEEPALTNSHQADELIMANDSFELDQEERERVISRRFAEQGITVKFIN